ncbi:MAG: acyl carrier protein [Clostridia bacterium]|nr:acyl carrier protein [Clostridia bacterium]
MAADIFEKIKGLLEEHTDVDVDTITLETPFADLGIDSLDTVEMVMELEDDLGVELELEEKVATVGDLVKFIESKLA